MTQQTKDRLLAELAELSEPHIGSGTADITEQQARQARIHQIHDLLSVAVVGEDPPDDGVAEPGMVLTVRYDDGDTETFLLGVRDDDQSGLEVYSPQSPLGKAITGARPGEQRSYQVPSGANVTVTLLDAVPYGMHQTQHPA
jgi:transcription elongation GreA/GreB family factor